MKGSSCFSTVTRDRAHLGNRMAPPVSHFGPGHYNISYEAQEKHSGVKDMRVRAGALPVLPTSARPCPLRPPDTSS